MDDAGPTPEPQETGEKIESGQCLPGKEIKGRATEQPTIYNNPKNKKKGKRHQTRAGSLFRLVNKK
jgi:hypothetical protein